MHRTEISILNPENEPKKSLKKKINHIDITVNNRSGNKKVNIININNTFIYNKHFISFFSGNSC